MDRKFNFLVATIIVLIVILLLYGILAVYKIVVFQGIYKTLDANVEIDNYSLMTDIITPTGKQHQEYYYKKGIAKNITSNGVYIWSDGETSYMVDEGKKKTYIMPKDSPEILTLFGDNRNKVFANLVPGYQENLFNRIMFAIDVRVHIRHEEIDGNKVFRITDARNPKMEKTLWIDVTTKKPIKGEAVMRTSEKKETVNYNYTLRFLATVESNIALPNMKDNQLIDYKTGEVIAENLDFDK